MPNSKKPRKAIVIGLDGARPDFIKKWVEEGKLPNIASLIRKGVFAEVVVMNPTVTAPGWATIATGAWAGTHGITHMGVHLPGKPLDYLNSGFDTTICKAEYIWNAAERVGKRTILLKYSGSWPPTMKEGVQVGGHGAPGYASNLFEISPCMLFTTERLDGAVRIKLKPAEGWMDMPKSASELLETTIRIVPKAKGWAEQVAYKITYDDFYVTPLILKGPEKNLRVLIVDSRGKGYDKAIISDGKDAERPLAVTIKGAWSEWSRTSFLLEEGEKIGTFRFKLIDISSDGKKLKLYMSQIFPTQGHTVPESISDELLSNVGPYQEHIGEIALFRGWIDFETYFEEAEYQARWIVDAGNYLMTKYDWNLFLTQWHCIDHTSHTIWGGIDAKHPDYDPAEASRYWDILQRAYRVADGMVGKLMKLAGEDTLITIVSDHGHTGCYGSVNISKALVKEGLLYTKSDGETGEVTVDWTKTRAYPQTQWHIYVNLKGRDPQGIVNPGSDYEKVQESVIEALYSLRDPKTNEHPIALAVKREDASGLGLYGERIGDVVFAVKQGYNSKNRLSKDTTIYEPADRLLHELTSRHGCLLATYKDMHAVLIMAGPNVKKGYVRTRPVRLVDFAPTVAHLMGIPTPEQSDGAIIWDALT